MRKTKIIKNLKKNIKRNIKKNTISNSTIINSSIKIIIIIIKITIIIIKKIKYSMFQKILRKQNNFLKIKVIIKITIKGKIIIKNNKDIHILKKNG